MQIRVYATLRELMGSSRLEVPVGAGTTAGDVLATLTHAHPALGPKLWDGNQKLTGFVTILLNGRSIEYLQGLQTPVTEADVISLFPPVGGGSRGC